MCGAIAHVRSGPKSGHCACNNDVLSQRSGDLLFDKNLSGVINGGQEQECRNDNSRMARACGEVAAVAALIDVDERVQHYEVIENI